MGATIGIFSAKGGVGKSLLAVNLGVCLQAMTKRPTLAVDFNPVLGGLDLLLDLKTGSSWGDLVDILDEIEPRHIELAVSRHKTGLDLLSSPVSIQEIENLSGQDIIRLFSALGAVYDFCVIDSQTGGGRMTRELYASVDYRLVVLTPEIPAVRATRRWLEGTAEERKGVWLVVNQYTSTPAVQAKELRRYLEIDSLTVLPMDPAAAWRNISFGEICVLKRRGALARAVRGLAVSILDDLDRIQAKFPEREQ